MRKANITKEEFDILLSLLFENIEIVPQSDYKKYLHVFGDEIKDQKDIPYLAIAIATCAAGIWSHDSHFLNQKKVKIFTNIDMLNMIKN